MANAVTIAIASPKMVRPSALIPDAVQTFADWLQSALDLCTPTSVEHPPRVPPRPAGTVPPADIAGTHVDCAKDTSNVGVAVPAKTYPTDKLRNVALVGHGGAGKTSLTEALLFVTGTIPRQGRVEDGSTVTDFDPEEARRRISTSLGIAPFEHEGIKINVLDTPGYADFITDVAAAFRAADLAIFVVSAVEGVEVQTEVVWRMASDLGLPRAFFVNKLDRERASFSRTLDQLKEKFGAGVAPLQLPIGEEAEFRGVVDLLDDTAVLYSNGSGTGETGPIPAEMEIRGAQRPRLARRRHRGLRRRPDGAVPRRRDHPVERAGERARPRGRVGVGVPGAVRERDEGHRRRPARALHRRRGPATGGEPTGPRSRSCSRRSSTRTSGA